MLVIWIVTESSYVHEIPVIDEITIYDNEEGRTQTLNPNNIRFRPGSQGPCTIAI